MPRISVPDGAHRRIDDLQANSPYSVHFDAAGENQGTTTATVGWVPVPGVDQSRLPAPQVNAVAPNGSCDAAGIGA
jgi:hypothetical protein